MRSLRPLLPSCLLVLSFALTSGRQDATAAPVTQVVVFGDSLSDGGNVYHQLSQLGYPYPPEPYYQGRFSNGPVWAEVYCENLGLPPLTASLDGGNDWAYGGAQTGGGYLLPDLRLLPNMATQVDQYLAVNRPSAGSELFALWGGANDFFQGQTDPTIPAANIAAMVRTLHAAGADQFLVLNLPPLGLTPAYLGTPDEGPMNARSVAFNVALAADLAQLRSDLGVSIEEVNAYALFQQVVADPAAYGLTNVTQPAYSNGSVVANPDQYLFWDDVHPTAVIHRLLAGEIPEPASLLLLLAAAGSGLAWRQRRRR